MKLTYRLVVWVALTLVPSITYAAEKRCALIDIDQSALGGLMEADLLVLPDTQWVERSEIQKLVNEKQLQSLFSAQSGNDRRSVGGFLKADVLIILRTIEEDNRNYAQLVVAETNQGIRLLSQKMLLGKDTASDAQVLVKLANEAIAKSQGPIRHIFAVPPFVSDDLTYEYDYLKSTYAKLLERTLLDSPGVVVVELDEAKAIANEYNLAASDANVQRQLPIYVLGEYRNEGRAEDRRVQLSLKAQQGAKLINEKNEKVKPDSVSKTLLSYAQDLAASRGIETSPIAPEQEVKILNERANLFMRLANWDEVQALVEASLLLVPDQPEVHSQAVTIIQEQLKHKGRSFLDDRLHDVQLKRQAMQHLRVLAQKSRFDLAKRHWLIFRSIPFTGNRVYVEDDPVAKQLVEISRSYQDLHREVAMQMVHGLAKLQAWQESSYILFCANQYQTPERRYADLKKIVLEYQELAQGEHYARSYLLAGRQKDMIESIEGRKFVQELIDSPEALPHVRQTAAAILKEIQPKAAKKINNLSNADSTENNRLTFQKVELDPLKEFYEIEALGGPWDIIRSDEGYYLYSKERGVRKVWDRLRNAGAKFQFDGRYIWAAVRDDDGGIGMAVIDPETGEQYDFDKEDGLPLLSMKEVPDDSVHQCDISITPLGVGRAIVVGFVGRTWFADVTFSADGNHQVNLFHEAKKTLPADRNSVDPKDLDIRFSPFFMALLERSEDGNVAKRGVFVVRNANNPAINSHPLLINPDDLTIEVLDRDWGEFTGGWLIEGQLYVKKVIELRNKGLGIYRRGIGDEQKSLVLSEYEEGSYCYDEQEKIFHIAGKQWRQANLETGEITSLGPVPWVYRNTWKYSGRDDDAQVRLAEGTYGCQRLYYTKNFGVVAMCTSEDRSERLWLQVLFDGSGQSFKEVAGISNDGDDTQQSRPDFQPLRITGQENLWNRERITDLTYFPNGKYIVTVSELHDRAVRVWNASSGTIVASLLDDPKGMNRVAFSPSGEYFATGGNDGRVILWDAHSLRPVKEFTDLKKTVIGMVFSADSERLAATHEEGDACVWNVESGEKQFNFYGCESWRGFSKLAFTPDDEMILSIQAQSPVWAHDANDGTDVGKIEAFEWVAGFMSDGSMLGVGEDIDNDLVRRQPDGTTHVAWPRFPGGPIGMSHDARFIATYFPYGIRDKERDMTFGRVEVWESKSKSLVFADEGLRFPRLAFSPDGTTLILQDAKGYAQKVELVSTVADANEMEVREVRPAGDNKIGSSMRTWTDRSGQFQIQASLVRADENTVVLKASSGEQLTVPLEVLSEADRRYLRELAKRN